MPLRGALLDDHLATGQNNQNKECTISGGKKRKQFAGHQAAAAAVTSAVYMALLGLSLAFCACWNHSSQRCNSAARAAANILTQRSKSKKQGDRASQA